MTTAQPGIFSLGTRTHLHLEFDVADGADVQSAVRRLRDAANPIVGVNVVVGFGPGIWARRAPDQAPIGLSDFESIVGPDGFTMPAGQHDLWVWLHGGSNDAVFDVGRIAVAELAPDASVASEQWSFVYGSSHDMTGFEDGTENPAGRRGDWRRRSPGRSAVCRGQHRAVAALGARSRRLRSTWAR